MPQIYQKEKRKLQKTAYKFKKDGIRSQNSVNKGSKKFTTMELQIKHSKVKVINILGKKQNKRIW